MTRMSVVAGAVLLLAGCLVLETGRARELYVAPEYSGSLTRATWLLDSVDTEQELASPSIEADAAYILRLMIARRNQQADPAAGTLLLRVRIKERELPVDLHTRRTATVEIEVYPPAGGGPPAAMLLYSETTAHGVRSYAYLSGLLERALRRLRGLGR